MAARDILTLNTPIASRLIRCLYIVALVLISVLVILGLIRGVRVMTYSAPPRPAITGQAQTPVPTAPDAAAPQSPQPGFGPRRFGQQRFFERRFRRPIGPFGIGRVPVLAGLWIIFGTLLRGVIALLVVRILAEVGLAILAMPRRSEI